MNDKTKPNYRPDAYVTVYMPLAGWKAVLLTRDPKCDNMHTPYETGSFAFTTKAAAIKDAQAWAAELDLEFYDDQPDKIADAPNKTVREQLTEILFGEKAPKPYITEMNVTQMWSLFRKFKQNPDGSPDFRHFLSRAVPGYDCLMIHWCHMWLGIETDGYTHS